MISRTQTQACAAGPVYLSRIYNDQRHPSPWLLRRRPGARTYPPLPPPHPTVPPARTRHAERCTPAHARRSIRPSVMHLAAPPRSLAMVPVPPVASHIISTNTRRSSRTSRPRRRQPQHHMGRPMHEATTAQQGWSATTMAIPLQHHQPPHTKRQRSTAPFPQCARPPRPRAASLSTTGRPAAAVVGLTRLTRRHRTPRPRARPNNNSSTGKTGARVQPRRASHLPPITRHSAAARLRVRRASTAHFRRTTNRPLARVARGARGLRIEAH